MRKDKLVADVLGEENVISPSEIYNQQFKRVLAGGYSPAEVDAFLERIADVMESLIVQLRVLKERYEEEKDKNEEYRQMESSLRSALVSSQKFGDDLLESARREASALVEEARAKRAQAELDASRLPTTLSRDIQLLQQQRQRLRTEMLAVIETHKRLLDSLIPEKPASVATAGEGTGEGFEGIEGGEQAAEDADIDDLDASQDTDIEI